MAENSLELGCTIFQDINFFGTSIVSPEMSSYGFGVMKMALFHSFFTLLFSLANHHSTNDVYSIIIIFIIRDKRPI
jgi:hypothetical protein